MEKIGEINIQEWEKTEIERSAVESASIDIAALRFEESNIARYINPPAETCYPLEYAYHLLGDVCGKTVLDLGCGNGENTVMLALRGAQVKSMDISTASIQIAKQRLIANKVTSNVNFFVGSAHYIPLADESIDMVFGIAILHHLDLSLIAPEVKRVLRKGGRGIFQEPVRNSKFIQFVRTLIPYKSPDASPFERPLTDEELIEFAQGYNKYHSKAFSLPYMSIIYIYFNLYIDCFPQCF
jgi:ubiquinone/menaquinone biosynthesis C-methylase UbiE